MSKHAYADGPSSRRGAQKWLAYKLGILGLSRGSSYEGKHRRTTWLPNDAVFYHDGYRVWYRIVDAWVYEEIS